MCDPNNRELPICNSDSAAEFTYVIDNCSSSNNTAAFKLSNSNPWNFSVSIISSTVVIVCDKPPHPLPTINPAISKPSIGQV